MSKSEEKGEKSPSIWDDVVEEKFINLLEKDFGLKTKQDCVNSKDVFIIKLMEENDFPTITCHNVTKKISEWRKEESISSPKLKNFVIPKKYISYVPNKMDIVEYVGGMVKFIKRYKIPNWKEFVCEKFKNKTYAGFDKFLNDLTEESAEEAEIKILSFICPDYIILVELLLTSCEH